MDETRACRPSDARLRALVEAALEGERSPTRMLRAAADVYRESAKRFADAHDRDSALDHAAIADELEDAARMTDTLMRPCDDLDELGAEDPDHA